MLRREEGVIGMRRLWTMAAILFVAGAGLGATVRAETPEELDALSDLSTDESAGVAFAQQQASRGEWLEALATLERVLAEHPKSSSARLLHALYLCNVDDRMGGAVEYRKLREKDYASEDLATVRTRCGIVGED